MKPDPEQPPLWAICASDGRTVMKNPVVAANGKYYEWVNFQKLIAADELNIPEAEFFTPDYWPCPGLKAMIDNWKVQANYQELIDEKANANVHADEGSELKLDFISIKPHLNSKSYMFPQPEKNSAQAESSSSKSNKEQLYKIVVVGDSGSNKTAAIRTYIKGEVCEDIPIRGIDVHNKKINTNREPKLVQFWELPEQEKFLPIIKTCCKGAAGALLICSLQNKRTIEPGMKEWHARIKQAVILENFIFQIIATIDPNLNYIEEINNNKQILAALAAELNIKYYIHTIGHDNEMVNACEELVRTLHASSKDYQYIQSFKS